MSDSRILKDYNLILIRYVDEIWLKSNKVKLRMLHTLMDNIKNMLKKAHIPYHKYQLSNDNARIFFFFDNNNIQNALKVLKKVFGIYSLSPAIRTSSNIKNISERALEIAAEVLRKGDSFALRVQRSGTHEFSSQDIAKEVGQIVLDHFKTLNLTVNLGSPDKAIFIEVRNQFTYIFNEIIETQWKGLPIELHKKLIVMDNGRVSDLLAGFFLMRRGCVIYPILFQLTDQEEVWNKRISNWEKVFAFMPFTHLKLIKIDLTNLIEKILIHVQEKEYICAFCRLFRFIIISNIMDTPHLTGIEHSKAITDGIILHNRNLCSDEIDLESIACSHYLTNLPIFTPLIGLDKEEIITRKINISKELHELDYCKYKPQEQKFDLEKIKHIYKLLYPHIEKMILKIIKGQEIIKIKR